MLERGRKNRRWQEVVTHLYSSAPEVRKEARKLQDNLGYMGDPVNNNSNKTTAKQSPVVTEQFQKNKCVPPLTSLISRLCHRLTGVIWFGCKRNSIQLVTNAFNEAILFKNLLKAWHWAMTITKTMSSNSLPSLLVPPAGRSIHSCLVLLCLPKNCVLPFTRYPRPLPLLYAPTLYDTSSFLSQQIISLTEKRVALVPECSIDSPDFTLVSLCTILAFSGNGTTPSFQSKEPLQSLYLKTLYKI